MRTAILGIGGVLCACALSTALAKPTPTVLLVGVLSEQHSRRCGPDYKEEWIDPHLEVGFVRLLTARPQAHRTLLGKMVVARGAPATSPPPSIVHRGPCPAAQMRSDWVWSKSGARIRRPVGPSPAPAVLSAATVERFDGLEVTPSPTDVRIRFKNTLKRDLRDVTLTLHYEGCYGKPGTSAESRKLSTVRAGQEVTVSWPLVAKRGMVRGREAFNAAYSVQVSSITPGVHFDLDWKLDPRGLPVGCPSRR
jgi:hypothetical protein